MRGEFFFEIEKKFSGQRLAVSGRWLAVRKLRDFFKISGIFLTEKPEQERNRLVVSGRWLHYGGMFWGLLQRGDGKKCRNGFGSGNQVGR